MHFKNWNLFFLAGIVSLTLVAFGCSGGDPVNPEPVESGSLQVQADGGSGHYLWGDFTLEFTDVYDDAGNVVWVDVEAVPVRTSQQHFNLTQFVQPPFCPGCIKIIVDSFTIADPYSELVVTVQLYNKTALTGYDVRGIIYSDYDGFTQKPYVLIENLQHENRMDGLTELYNDGMPMEINPYMAFHEFHQQGDIKRPFPGHAWEGATYYFMKRNDYQMANIPYKIDVSWPSNADEAVGVFIPADWDTDALFYPEGSDAMLTAVIFDWQNNIESVALDFSDFGLTESAYMTEVNQDPANYASTWIYHVTEPAGPVAPDPFKDIRMIVSDPVETYDYIYDVRVEVTNDTDPPEWVDTDQRGIYDHISCPGNMTLFYHEAQDPSKPLQYIFYGNSESSAFDGAVLKVETDETYTGWTDMGAEPSASPANVPFYYGIRLQDGPGHQDAFMDEYVATRYSAESRWSFLGDQPPGQDGILGSPTIGDVNNDGQDDIVVGSRNNSVYVYEGDGTGTQNTILWEYETGGEVQCSPALVDLNDDDKLEVIVASDDGSIYALQGTTGLPYWSYYTGDGYLMHASPSIAYINGDNVPDVLCGTGDGHMYALNGAGPTDPGDPESIVLWVFEAGGGIAGTPAVADVTGDTIADVCFGAYDTRMYMVNGATGEEIWNYYVGPGMNNIDCSPAMVDINFDEVPDIVFGARDDTGELGGTIFAINGTSTGGNVMELWIQPEIWGNPRRGITPVQIDDDGVVDFLITAYQTETYSYYAISGADGSFIYQRLAPDIPIGQGMNYTGILVGDFTGDGHLNGLYARKDGYCDLINLRDFDLPGNYWPGAHLMSMQVSTGSKLEIMDTPAVGDVDGDGEIELIACNLRGWTYILDLHAPVPADPDMFSWTQHSGNRWHTGTPGFVPPK